METGLFHMLRCVVSCSLCHCICEQKECWYPCFRSDLSGASAVAHTCDQIPDKWVDNVQLLTFPSNTYPDILPGKDGVPRKISVEINVLLSAKMRELWKAQLPQLMSCCCHTDTTFLVTALSQQDYIALTSKQKPSVVNNFLSQ